MNSREQRNRIEPARLLARSRGPVSLVCTLLLLWSCGLASYNVAMAQSAPGTGEHLDLTSSAPSISASGAVSSPVSINVGGTIRVVDSNSVLTPGEFVAAVQVASGGAQSISLAANGAATGGNFVASQLGQLAGLNIPSGVTAIHDFATGNSTINGNLTNSGTLYGISTSNGVRSGTFNATNIFNQSGGLLTSVLPTGGLAGFSNLVNNLSLTLNALNDIINHGTISSAGSLNLIAGNAIVNASSSSTPSVIATIQAANALNISTLNITNQGTMSSLLSDVNVQTRNMTNSGLLSALSGSINLENLTGTTLSVINTNGAISARDSVLFSINGNSMSNLISVIGGNISGSDASFDANNNGRLHLDMISLPEVVDVNGRTISISISGGTGLDLTGLDNQTGGSLAYAGAGDVTFRGFDTNGGSVNVQTTGNILVLGPGNSGNADITTANAGGNSGSISLITTGGSITVDDISTASLGTRNAGNITLIAGQSIQSGNLNASSASGTPGDIVVRAGTAGSGNVDMGGADVSAGSGNSGDVTITAPGDVVVNGAIDAPNGTITLGGATTTVTGPVTIGGGNVNWELPDTGQYIVDLALLTRFGGNTVTVGGANYSSDIIIQDNCSGCLGSVNNMVFNTTGRYIATGTTITLGADSQFSVSAEGGINTGSVTAGALTFSTDGILQVDGQLNSANSVSLVGGDITVDGGSALTAGSGNVLLAAANDITLLPGSRVEAHANESGTAGGRIGILAGTTSGDLNAILNALEDARTGHEILMLPAGGAWDAATNVVNSTGGSIMQVVFPEGANKSISNSTFNLNGGVVFIDPPGTNNVNISGATFIAVGPTMEPPTTGGGNGTPGGGTGGTIGGGTGGNGGIVTQPSIDLSTLSGTLSLPTINTNTISTTTSRDTANAAISAPQVTSTGQSRDTVNSAGPDGSTLRAAIYCAPPGKLQERDDLSDQDAWIIASNKCQPFSFEAPDGSIVIGTGPAIFAPTTNRTLLLKEGKLMIIAGEGMIVVRTPMCNVTIPANSAATVEFSQTGLTRVTGLAGGKASVSVTRQGETIILTAAAGEQLLLAEDTVPNNEMQCLPDVPNKKNDTWLVRLAGLRGEKFTFDRTEMVSREGLLNCTLGCFTKLQQSMIDQIRKSMLMESAKELKSALPTRQLHLISKALNNKSHLSAVGFGDVLDLTVPDVASLRCGTAFVKYTRGANITILDPNKLNVRNGDALVSTTAPTTVIAGKYTVKLAPSTVALISHRGEHVVVRNVYESRSTAIQVITPEGKCIGAQVGHEVIVGRSNMSYTQVLNEDAVGRRRMRHCDLDKTRSVISSEVSLVSLLQNTNILSQMCRSEHPDDKEILNKVMKMAVALQMSTGRHGSYSIVGQ